MAADPNGRLFFKSNPLNAVLAPTNVAVIGATEKAGEAGRTVLWNLISNPFGGTVFPVNPERRASWASRPTPTSRAVPEQVDLAVIVTPAPSVPGRHRGVRRGGRARRDHHAPPDSRTSAPKGAELESRILDVARSGRMRDHRPELPGRDEPVTGLNATFASSMARPGSVGFISQSGALCTAVLDWSLRRRSASARSSPSARCSTWLGRPDRLPGQRPAHQEHRDLHGVDRRRARVPLGGARGGAHQADHRDQGRPHRRRRPRPPPRTPARSPAATRCSMRPSAAAACCA